MDRRVFQGGTIEKKNQEGLSEDGESRGGESKEGQSIEGMEEEDWRKRSGRGRNEAEKLIDSLSPPAAARRPISRTPNCTRKPSKKFFSVTSPRQKGSGSTSTRHFYYLLWKSALFPHELQAAQVRSRAWAPPGYDGYSEPFRG